MRAAGFREALWRGYSRPDVDELLERIAIRMEADQSSVDIVRQTKIGLTVRGYEADDVDRLTRAVTGEAPSTRERRPVIPVGRADLVSKLQRIIPSIYVVALFLTGVAWLTSKQHHFQIWPVLGLMGFGAAILAFQMIGFKDNEGWEGIDVRGFLTVIALLAGLIGGVLGLNHQTVQNRLGGVAIGLAGIAPFALYVRKIWVRFRRPVGGRHAL